MAYGVVYRITNTFNDKIYIGQTTRTVEQRFKEHMDSPYLIGKAMRALGVENFTIEVIEECETQEELNEREIAKIAEYDCLSPKGYNLKTGGEGGSHCEETKVRIATTITGSKQTAEHRANSSAAQQKRWLDPAEHEKASAAQFKRYEDPAEHLKTSLALKKSRAENPLSPESHAKQAATLSKRYAEHPEERQHLADMANKQFETPESRKNHARIMVQYYADNPVSDEAKAHKSAAQRARQAKLRLQKVAGENQAATEWNVSAQELKVFHAENYYTIKPHSTDDRKARTEIKRAAKRLAAVMTQNKTAAKLKNLSALGKYHAEHFDATKKHSAVVYDYTAERIASRREAAKRGNAKKRVERLPRMVARENQLAARLPELFKLKIYLSRLEQGNSQVLKNDSGSNR